MRVAWRCEFCGALQEVLTGRCIHTLTGHRGEISSCQFNWTGELCISGSIDRTCKIWNVATGKCENTLRGHNDEILDVAFNLTGSKLVTVSNCSPRRTSHWPCTTTFLG